MEYIHNSREESGREESGGGGKVTYVGLGTVELSIRLDFKSLDLPSCLLHLALEILLSQPRYF